MKIMVKSEIPISIRPAGYIYNQIAYLEFMQSLTLVTGDTCEKLSFMTVFL